MFPFLVTRLSEWYGNAQHHPFRFVGIIFICFGLALYYSLLSAFANRGKGTPAPYDPPKKLVTDGILGVIRNPNYLANYMIVLGEAILFESFNIFTYFLLLLVATTAYLILHEEPELRKRYGQEFIQYETSVPRWIPNLHSVKKLIK